MYANSFLIAFGAVVGLIVNFFVIASMVTGSQLDHVDEILFLPGGVVGALFGFGFSFFLSKKN